MLLIYCTELYRAAPSIITSRGCPYHCTFCTEPHNFAGSVRFRSVAAIVEELELLHCLTGRTLFLFQDDILPLDRPRFAKLLDAFRGLSFPLEWKCFSRVDLMDEELMLDMVDAGCVQVRYGIESGSDKTLKRIKKGFTIDQAYQVTKLSVKHFRSVHAAFIWGYPFESMRDFEETLEWVSEFERINATVLLFEYSPLPGCALAKEFTEGLEFSKDMYSNYVITGHEVVRPDQYGDMAGHDPIYDLIARHPRIFSGFYHYQNMTSLRKQQRLEHYKTTRRTPARNRYDR